VLQFFAAVFRICIGSSVGASLFYVCAAQWRGIAKLMQWKNQPDSAGRASVSIFTEAKIALCNSVWFV
jgi:hypothetical protein